MIDINLHPTDRILRQFAGASLLLFGGLAANQWLMRGNPRTAAALLVAAFVVGVAGLVRPRAVRWLFVAATLAAFPMGWLLSQVMLVVLFVAVITPVALLFKLRGRDRLARHRRAEQTSYWRPKASTGDMGRYLRQY
jgi:saxitoxin biosynthesis operon SxtJ-like protein